MLKKFTLLDEKYSVFCLTKRIKYTIFSVGGANKMANKKQCESTEKGE